MSAAPSKGRKDQFEEQQLPARALELLDEALFFAQEVWNDSMDKDDRQGQAFNLRSEIREYLIDVGYILKDRK